jgi:hypothetical protein
MGLLVCAFLPCLVGASISISTATGNPNGWAGCLKEAGSFSLGGNEFYHSVHAYAENQSTGAQTIAPASVVGGAWDRTHTGMAFPVTYTCWGKLYYRVGTGGVQSVNSSTMNGTVAF